MYVGRKGTREVVWAERKYFGIVLTGIMRDIQFLNFKLIVRKRRKKGWETTEIKEDYVNVTTNICILNASLVTI